MLRIAPCVLVLGLVACGGGSTPLTPPASPPPTPAPTPTPTPNPFAAACGVPLPPFESSHGFGIKVQLEPSRRLKVINASPQVRNAEYCTAAGIGGVICNTRYEYLAERVPCDHYLSGISETGRPGPNWYQEINGRRLKCGGMGVAGEAPDCNLKENNQYLLDVRAGGKYVACGGIGSPGTCGSCVLYESAFGVIHQSPAGLCRLSGDLR
jgi:hypothetical protein